MKRTDEDPDYWKYQYKRRILSENLKRYMDNWAIIRVWFINGNFDIDYLSMDFIKNLFTGGEVGHASLQTKNCHISLWPKKRPTIISTLLHTGTEKYINNIRQDFLDEGRIADFCIVLHTLDVTTIEQNFSSLDPNLYYDLIGSKKTWGSGQNCSGLVVQLLASGTDYIESLKDTDSLLEVPTLDKVIYDKSVIYTPNDVAELATHLKMQEIKFFQHLGASYREIEALDMIEDQYFLKPEINLDRHNKSFYQKRIRDYTAALTSRIPLPHNMLKNLPAQEMLSDELSEKLNEYINIENIDNEVFGFPGALPGASSNDLQSPFSWPTIFFSGSKAYNNRLKTNIRRMEDKNLQKENEELQQEIECLMSKIENLEQAKSA